MDINVGHFRQHHTQKMAIISLQQRNKICKASENPAKTQEKKNRISKSEGQAKKKWADHCQQMVLITARTLYSFIANNSEVFFIRSLDPRKFNAEN